MARGWKMDDGKAADHSTSVRRSVNVWRLCRARDRLVREAHDWVRPATFLYLPCRADRRNPLLVRLVLYFYTLLGGLRRPWPRYHADLSRLGFVKTEDFTGAFSFGEASLTPSDTGSGSLRLKLAKGSLPPGFQPEQFSGQRFHQEVITPTGIGHPASVSARAGNFVSSVLSSCRQTMSGLVSFSHSSSRGRRPLTPLTL